MSLPPPPQRGPRSPPSLVDDAMREIFLRLSPDDPKSLVRAAAVCPTWRGILSDAAFARVYRASWGAPPMLGFLYYERRTDEGPFHEQKWVTHFVSTAAFRPPAWEDRQHWHVLDSRHGLVLFLTPRSDDELVVCDLVTNDQWRIRADRECFDVMWWKVQEDAFEDERLNCHAAVLCAKDRCDHLDCHGGPFRVALVGSDEEESRRIISAIFYSSETCEWSDVIRIQHPNFVGGTGHSAVLGNKVYVPCVEGDSVVEYNIDEQELSVIDAPPPFKYQDQPYLELLGVEDYMLLFVTVLNCRLYLWLMEFGPNGAPAWAGSRVINLEPLLPPAALLDLSELLLVGFAEGVSVIFLCTGDGLYTIELNSSKIKKVHEEADFTKVVPYMSFYTGVAWARRRVIELETLLHPDALLDMKVVGFAEGVCVVFLMTEDGLYTIEPNSYKIKNLNGEKDFAKDALHPVEFSSGEIKKVHEKKNITKVIPYMSFYKAAWGRLPAAHEASRTVVGSTTTI